MESNMPSQLFQSWGCNNISPHINLVQNFYNSMAVSCYDDQFTTVLILNYIYIKYFITRMIPNRKALSYTKIHPSHKQILRLCH